MNNVGESTRRKRLAVKKPTTEPEVLWVHGRVQQCLADDCAIGTVWELQGVYRTESEAVCQCVDIDDFVGPIHVGQVVDGGPTLWPGCYYPQLSGTDAR